MRGSRIRVGVLAGGLVVAATAAAVAVAGTFTGPSSSQAPYVIPSQPNVHTVALLTVGDSVQGTDNDAVPGYQMVGIPDGLGAFDNKNGTFTVLMNHELVGTAGIVRDHGAMGAFVSKWIISKRTLKVLSGQDLMQQVALAPGGVYQAPAKGIVFSRFCSADLPEQSALYDKRSRLGYADRLFLDGEENGTEGRAIAHALNGTSYELPAVGKMAFENVVLNPSTGVKTVATLTDDGTGNQVYVYVGSKQRSGNPAEKAGLTNGSLYGLRIPGLTQESDLTPPSGAPYSARFELANLGDVRAKTGLQLEADSNAALVTHWQRPEDSSWDPKHPNDLYFVTTASPTNKSRLWRLRFDDRKNPAAGGRIELLLDGNEGQIMFDNMTVDRHGRVLIQEDPGNNVRVAKVWSYDIKSDTLTEIATHDPARFLAPPAGTTNPSFITQDEESSGIIPLDDVFGPGWYLFDSQIHDSTFADPAQKAKLVEKGQLLALYYPVGHRGDHDDDDHDDGDE